MLGIELEVQSILIEFRQYNFEVRWSASRILDLEGWVESQQAGYSKQGKWDEQSKEVRNTTKCRLQVKGDTRTPIPSLHPGGVTDPLARCRTMTGPCCGIGQEHWKFVKLMQKVGCGTLFYLFSHVAGWEGQELLWPEKSPLACFHFSLVRSTWVLCFIPFRLVTAVKL